MPITLNMIRESDEIIKEEFYKQLDKNSEPTSDKLHKRSKSVILPKKSLNQKLFEEDQLKSK